MTFLFPLGVNTGDILTAYVSAIRALRVLDHTGVLLELVCEPVRKYLRFVTTGNFFFFYQLNCNVNGVSGVIRVYQSVTYRSNT